MKRSDVARSGAWQLRRRTVRVLGAAVVVAACGGDGGEWGGTITDSAGVAIVQNPAEGNWTLQDAPQLVEDLRIGVAEGDPAYQFGMIAQTGGIDVTDDGTIYVLDAQARNVRAFDSEGRHLRTIGRPGTGPGELSQAPAAVLAGPRNGAVYVADMMRQRIVAFGPDGTETGSTSLMIQNGIPLRFQPMASGRWAVQVRRMQLPGMADTVQTGDRILLRDPASEAADTLIELESGRTMEFRGDAMPRMRLFSPEPIWAVLPDGRLAQARNDAFRIEIFGAPGGRSDLPGVSPGPALQRVITRSVERKPVTQSDRDAIITMIRRQMESQPMPPAMREQFLQGIEFADLYPAFASLLGGPGNTLWVQRIATAREAERDGRTFDAQDIGSATWDVFDSEGRLLGPVQMPARFSPVIAEGTSIYGVLRDELDVQYVVRLRVTGL